MEGYQCTGPDCVWCKHGKITQELRRQHTLRAARMIFAGFNDQQTRLQILNDQIERANHRAEQRAKISPLERAYMQTIADRNAATAERIIDRNTGAVDPHPPGPVKATSEELGTWELGKSNFAHTFTPDPPLQGAGRYITADTSEHQATKEDEAIAMRIAILEKSLEILARSVASSTYRNSIFTNHENYDSTIRRGTAENISKVKKLAEAHIKKHATRIDYGIDPGSSEGASLPPRFKQ